MKKKIIISVFLFAWAIANATDNHPQNTICKILYLESTWNDADTGKEQKQETKIGETTADKINNSYIFKSDIPLYVGNVVTNSRKVKGKAFSEDEKKFTIKINRESNPLFEGSFGNHSADNNEDIKKEYEKGNKKNKVDICLEPGNEYEIKHGTKSWTIIIVNEVVDSRTSSSDIYISDYNVSKREKGASICSLYLSNEKYSVKIDTLKGFSILCDTLIIKLNNPEEFKSFSIWADSLTIQRNGTPIKSKIRFIYNLNDSCLYRYIVPVESASIVFKNRDVMTVEWNNVIIPVKFTFEKKSFNLMWLLLLIPLLVLCYIVYYCLHRKDTTGNAGNNSNDDSILTEECKQIREGLNKRLLILFNALPTKLKEKINKESLLNINNIEGVIKELSKIQGEEKKKYVQERTKIQKIISKHEEKLKLTDFVNPKDEDIQLNPGGKEIQEELREKEEVDNGVPNSIRETLSRMIDNLLEHLPDNIKDTINLKSLQNIDNPQDIIANLSIIEGHNRIGINDECKGIRDFIERNKSVLVQQQISSGDNPQLPTPLEPTIFDEIYNAIDSLLVAETTNETENHTDSISQDTYEKLKTIIKTLSEKVDETLKKEREVAKKVFDESKLKAIYEAVETAKKERGEEIDELQRQKETAEKKAREAEESAQKAVDDALKAAREETEKEIKALEGKKKEAEEKARKAEESKKKAVDSAVKAAKEEKEREIKVLEGKKKEAEEMSRKAEESKKKAVDEAVKAAKEEKEREIKVLEGKKKEAEEKARKAEESKKKAVDDAVKITEDQKNKELLELESKKRTEIDKLKSELRDYTCSLHSVPYAESYSKQIHDLIAVGNQIQSAAYSILDTKVSDPYFIRKALTIFGRLINEIDMEKFLTDVNMASKARFVFNDSSLATFKEDNKDIESIMRDYFFKQYLGKYINAIMVLNESMSGLKLLLPEVQSKVGTFEKYRSDILSLAKLLKISVSFVRVGDMAGENIDLKAQTVDVGIGKPGQILEIENCIVYQSEDRKPQTKIRVTIKK